MIIDKPLAELKQYKPSPTRQHDFDAFWEQTLSESADQPLVLPLSVVDNSTFSPTCLTISLDPTDPSL